MEKKTASKAEHTPIANGLPPRIVLRFLYGLFLTFYEFAIRVYSPFNAKAKKWIEGRKDWEHYLNEALKPGEKRIWIHCSSLGEFEQAKPLIEVLREQYPAYKIVVTFFSPSGYEACKRNSLADYVFYLPHDSSRNAEQFVAAVNPALAMFVKYEFWYYYLRQLKMRAVPALLVSGAFREGQVFFKWYGGLFRDMLRCFSFFFLQDEQSRKMLHKIGFDEHIAISGDTRYDRVAVIAQNAVPILAVEKFKEHHKILIAGSTWPGDEDVLKESVPILPADWKLIIVPHEVGAEHIRKVRQLFGENTILFSELDAENTGTGKRILVIDNIGMLSRLFAYGDIAFIGGGFQKGGIHNILEPAVFGLPVVFGPIYEKFVEAKELVGLRYVFPVNNAAESNAILGKLITDTPYRKDISESLKKFMREHTGATKMIMDGIRGGGWLK